MHVLADAATSVLAIVALFGGKIWGKLDGSGDGPGWRGTGFSLGL